MNSLNEDVIGLNFLSAHLQSFFNKLVEFLKK